MNETIYIDLETQVFLYLDRLRESGITNMFGAGPYVENEFGLGRQEAKEHLIEWMETFEDRHPNV
jgi:hypothetical protein